MWWHQIQGQRQGMLERILLDNLGGTLLAMEKGLIDKEQRIAEYCFRRLGRIRLYILITQVKLSWQT